MDMSKKGMLTKCVRGGLKSNDVYKSLKTPIYMNASYELPTDGSLVDMVNENTNFYSRHGNPNQVQLQEKIALLEEAEETVVFATGVAAISAVFTTFLDKGDHVLFSEVCYAATTILLKDLLSSKGIEADYVDTTDLEAVKNALKPNTKLIHLETPGNPTTGISDIEEITKIAHDKNILVSVDSTFASPYLQKPLKHGADFSIHSMTKYISGHGDCLGGCVSGEHELIARLKKEAMINFGGAISPFNAWLIDRGLTTLPLRMRQHCDAAMVIALFLEAYPSVKFVHYPGLKSHPQYELASKYLEGGYSGIVSFDIDGDEETKLKFLSSLEMIIHAVSFGDNETMIVHNAKGNPKLDYYPEIFRNGFFRLSTGLEDTIDIIADIKQALEKVKLL